MSILPSPDRPSAPTPGEPVSVGGAALTDELLQSGRCWPERHRGHRCGFVAQGFQGYRPLWLRTPASRVRRLARFCHQTPPRRYAGSDRRPVGEPQKAATGVQGTGLMAAPVATRISPRSRRWIKPWLPNIIMAVAMADGATAEFDPQRIYTYLPLLVIVGEPRPLTPVKMAASKVASLTFAPVKSASVRSAPAKSA